MGGGVSASILLRGEGRVMRAEGGGGGAQKKKSPDFRSSEVGISVLTDISAILSACKR